jgi:uncharacterized protein YoxC
MLLKVDGGQFVKDTNNKALLTIDHNAIKENEARKKLAERMNGKNNEINNLKEKVESLSDDISQIKQMLKQLLR